ncbi:MAG TPA: phosphopantothenoylcysteine decarboxylase [Candidatus Wallbacteria bacterium]|nr:phosphopantothenoylcysteine decarboxylase [Candidatus Wallbacteria bacterium]
MNVLITAGGTEEIIDGVRSITNTSTGATGAAIAEKFIQKGAGVVYVHAKRALKPSSLCEMVPFTDFSSLDSKLSELLSREKFDAIIHAAAVSDYSVAGIKAGDKTFAPSAAVKIESDSGEGISLVLKKNFKIIERLREYSSNKNITVIGFKLTNTPDERQRSEAVEKLLSKGGADFVAHNDLSGISAISHIVSLYSKNGVVAVFNTKVELAEGLYSLVARILKGEKP